MLIVSPGKPTRALLQLSRSTWRLHALRETLGSPPIAAGDWRPKEPEELAAAVRSALDEPRSAELVIALEADLCLATRFTAASPKQLRKRSALLYRLEESLPVAAEDVVAGFITSGVEVFAVTADRGWLEPLHQAMKTESLSVRVVTPLPLLATAEHLRRSRRRGEHLVSWRREEHHDLVACRDGVVTDWNSSSGAAISVEQALRVAALSSVAEAPVVAYASGGASFELAIGEEASWRAAEAPAEESGEAIEEHAAAMAKRVLRGEAHPVVNLLPAASGGSASEGDWPWVRIAASLLLLAVAWRFYEGASQHQAAADAAVNGQAAVFRGVFPDRRVPVGVRSRLASELRRLKGVRGEDGGVPERPRAVLLVQHVLAALPQEMRLRVLELRVQEGRVYLEGQVRSYADADRVAAALRESGLTVSSPSTQQLPGKGVDFRLTATPAAAEEKGAR